MEKNNGSFSYTYSAKQEDELKRILRKYEPRAEDKMEQLRLLDAKAEAKGMIWSLVSGVLGLLLMGGGMSLILVWQSLIFGLPLGIVGIAGIVAAYPLYVRITRQEREKIAPEILRLGKELSDKK